MLKIQKDSKIGNIFQLSAKLSTFLNDNFIILQTQGIPLPNAVLCSSECKVIQNLCKEDSRDVVIIPISAINISEELIARMRMVLCHGRNVYVVTKGKHKLWFVDQVLR